MGLSGCTRYRESFSTSLVSFAAMVAVSNTGWAVVFLLSVVRLSRSSRFAAFSRRCVIDGLINIGDGI
jgi:hypothetical protein